jgi:hypothetical protein
MRAQSGQRAVGRGAVTWRGFAVGRRLAPGRSATVRCGLIILVSLALVASACTKKPSEPPTSKPTGPAPAVEFTASVEPRATAIDISYRLVNRDDRVLYALNRVFRDNDPFRFASEPDEVYIVGRRGGVVEIAKRAFDKPPGFDYDAAAVLGGTRLAPGHSVAESFSVPLPLERRHPYGDKVMEGVVTLPDPIRAVVFCLGVVDIPPDDYPDYRERLLFVHDPPVTPAQHVFCSEPVPLT